MARYGRLPEECGERALGLYMNLDALDARDTMNMAAAIGVALSGDSSALARLVYAATGDARSAQRVEVDGAAAAARAKAGVSGA